MNVLGICASPRKGGNTETLLDKALEGAKEKGAKVDKIILNNLKMVPCQECEKVKDDGTCKIRDGFQVVWRKINDADALIFASPIFFGSLSAQAKIMIDRFQCYWRYKYILKKTKPGKFKPAALLLVEASTRESFLENAKSIIKNFFATVGFGYEKELFCDGVDERAAILKRKDCLDQAYKIGGKLAGK